MVDVKKLIRKVRKGSISAVQNLGQLNPDFWNENEEFREDSIRVVTEALSSTKASMRENAAWAIIGIGGDREGAVPALARLLNDPNSDVKTQAAEALSEIGATIETVPMLIDALNDEDALVRTSCAKSLEMLSSDARAAIPSLTEMLSDSIPEVRVQAAITLGAIGNEASCSLSSLYELLISSDSETQTYIVNSFIHICKSNPVAINQLRSLYQSSNECLVTTTKIVLNEVIGTD